MLNPVGPRGDPCRRHGPGAGEHPSARRRLRGRRARHLPLREHHRGCRSRAPRTARSRQPAVDRTCVNEPDERRTDARRPRSRSTRRLDGAGGRAPAIRGLRRDRRGRAISIAYSRPERRPHGVAGTRWRRRRAHATPSTIPRRTPARPPSGGPDVARRRLLPDRREGEPARRASTARRRPTTPSAGLDDRGRPAAWCLNPRLPSPRPTGRETHGLPTAPRDPPPRSEPHERSPTPAPPLGAGVVRQARRTDAELCPVTSHEEGRDQDGSTPVGTSPSPPSTAW